MIFVNRFLAGVNTLTFCHIYFFCVLRLLSISPSFDNFSLITNQVYILGNWLNDKTDYIISFSQCIFSKKKKFHSIIPDRIQPQILSHTSDHRSVRSPCRNPMQGFPVCAYTWLQIWQPVLPPDCR